MVGIYRNTTELFFNPSDEILWLVPICANRLFERRERQCPIVPKCLNTSELVPIFRLLVGGRKMGSRRIRVEKV